MNKMRKISIAATVVCVALAAIATTFLLTRSSSPFARLGEMQIGNGEVGVLYLGDSAFVLKTSGHTIIVDPASSVSQEAVRFLGKVNAILVTHEHSDHFVASATSELYRASEASVIANKGAYEILKGLIQRSDKLVKLEPGEKATTDGLVVEAIPSNHSGSSPVIFVITMDGLTILHASDSGFTPALETYKGKINLALLPTGTASPTASPSQAFKIAVTLLPKKVIPMHGSSAEHSEFRRLLASSPGIGIIEVQASDPQKVSVT